MTTRISPISGRFDGGAAIFVPEMAACEGRGKRGDQEQPIKIVVVRTGLTSVPRVAKPEKGLDSERGLGGGGFRPQDGRRLKEEQSSSNRSEVSVA